VQKKESSRELIHSERKARLRKGTKIGPSREGRRNAQNPQDGEVKRIKNPSKIRGNAADAGGGLCFDPGQEGGGEQVGKRSPKEKSL